MCTTHLDTPILWAYSVSTDGLLSSPTQFSREIPKCCIWRVQASIPLGEPEAKETNRSTTTTRFYGARPHTGLRQGASVRLTVSCELGPCWEAFRCSSS